MACSSSPFAFFYFSNAIWKEFSYFLNIVSNNVFTYHVYFSISSLSCLFLLSIISINHSLLFLGRPVGLCPRAALICEISASPNTYWLPTRGRLKSLHKARTLAFEYPNRVATSVEDNCFPMLNSIAQRLMISSKM